MSTLPPPSISCKLKCLTEAMCKATGANAVTHLNWTPNRHVFKDDYTMCLKFANHSKLTSQDKLRGIEEGGERDMYDHSIRKKKILTLTMNETFI